MADLTVQPLPSAFLPSRFSRAMFWATRGSLALMDQGLIAASNFGIGIVLARSLSPQEYGSYALAYAIFLLLSLAYQAIVLEPQRVFGSTLFENSQRGYFRALLRIHSGLGLGTGFVLGGLALLLHILRPTALPAALAGVMIAAPCVLLLWLLRGAFYVRMSPQNAVAGSSVYCAVLLIGMAVLYYLRQLSAFGAFVAMAIAALVGSVVLLIRFRLLARSDQELVGWKDVSLKHWEYGRWILLSSFLTWLSGDVYYPLVSSMSGMAAAGDLRALLNFSLPIAQALNALTVFTVPYAARVYQTAGLSALLAAIRKIGAVFVAIAVCYWAVVVVFNKPIMDALYRGTYADVASLLPLIAIGSLPWNFAYVPTIAFRAFRSSVSLLVIYCVSSAISLGIGIPATRMYGLRGTLWAMILSYAAALVTALMLLWRKVQADRVTE
jgi:O-antigen/teichoic acid export membrane protein